MEEEFTPRIVVKNDDDVALVLQALALFCDRMVNNIRGGDGKAIQYLTQAAELMSIIYGDAHRAIQAKVENDAVEEFRKTVLADDTTLRAFISEDDENN